MSRRWSRSLPNIAQSQRSENRIEEWDVAECVRRFNRFQEEVQQRLLNLVFGQWGGVRIHQDLLQDAERYPTQLCHVAAR